MPACSYNVVARILNRGGRDQSSPRSIWFPHNLGLSPKTRLSQIKRAHNRVDSSGFRGWHEKIFVGTTLAKDAKGRPLLPCENRHYCCRTVNDHSHSYLFASFPTLEQLESLQIVQVSTKRATEKQDRGASIQCPLVQLLSSIPTFRVFARLNSIQGLNHYHQSSSRIQHVVLALEWHPSINFRFGV